MTPHDAAKLLDLPVDAAPEQIETRFNELRAKLEDKVVKAPTPGLKAKYRESIDEITQAFESLVLATDSSSLPMLRRAAVSPAAASVVPTPGPAPAAAPPPPTIAALILMHLVGFAKFLLVTLGLGALALTFFDRALRRLQLSDETATKILLGNLLASLLAGIVVWAWSVRLARHRLAGNQKQVARMRRIQEIVAVLLVAVALLGGGGGWVYWKRAAHARQEARLGELRNQMVELNLAYDTIMRAEQKVESDLAGLRSKLSNLKDRDTPEGQRLARQIRTKELLMDWKHEPLPIHPVTAARTQAEQLLAAREASEAERAVNHYRWTIEATNSNLSRFGGDTP